MRNLLPLQLAVVFALCAWLWIKTTAVDPLPDWRQGELVVIVPPVEMETENAFQTELAEQFAQQLQVKLKTIALPIDQKLPALMTHKAHLATGVRETSDYALRFSKTYQSLDELVICHGATPDDIDNLAGRKLVVAAGSSQETALREVQREHDKLSWKSRRDTSPVELLEEVADGKLDCTVANEEQLATARNFYPELGNALDLDSPSELSWAFPANGDTKLYDEAQAFFTQIKQDGTLRRLIDRYYGYNERLNAINAEAFITQTRTLLPHYRRWFEEAADLTGIDWQTLAALSYQESHWDPNATSYTNVRGMMMLTEETADRMNVENRLDAHSSILAGARYLQLLKEQLPLRMNEDDRLWMALAAYNQGMGHLEDARILASQSGLDPDVWSDVKRMLPLLSRPSFYKKAKRGKARGGEAVILVETVRLYSDMLRRLDAQDSLYQLPPIMKHGILDGLIKLP
ncbi:membrane-bound lytic murein transglycosylase MltF [Sideroxydans lithotrophicus]|uniref:Lytic transglycosylase catalytic n=1 Tax=Sideroxydans lithotrophicus (strain ES-1) TaxID=580332 RepID=D5CN97_SIDLE|nr:membrane-bound lytic murein transglycosylase MltF [Sideroxydans lithotrophicus]ADE12794.1 Lytic transglycosylase catalytic [Sideroxydans lithotrophicus ES-1]